MARKRGARKWPESCWRGRTEDVRHLLCWQRKSKEKITSVDRPEDDLDILRKKDAVSAEELCRFCPEQFKPILAYLKRFSYWAANDDALEVDYGLIANEFKKQGPADMRR